MVKRGRSASGCAVCVGAALLLAPPADAQQWPVRGVVVDELGASVDGEGARGEIADGERIDQELEAGEVRTLRIAVPRR